MNPQQIADKVLSDLDSLVANLTKADYKQVCDIVRDSMESRLDCLRDEMGDEFDEN